VFPDTTVSTLSHIAARAAMAAVFVALLLLGVRSLISLDLGYNLEYGQTFLRTGHIVDHVDFLYTLPAPDLLAEERPAPGPGTWYDEKGHYRFVNANWLSQVVMAAVYTVAGVPGLGMLTTLLSIGVYVLVFVAARRLGVPELYSAIGLVLYALTVESRFNLRPELFGFVCLAAQLALLSAAARDRRRAAELSWTAVGVLLAVQVLFVNSHSYFMLGIGVAGAIFVGWGMRLGMARLRGVSDIDVLRQATLRMGAVVAGLAAVAWSTRGLGAWRSCPSRLCSTSRNTPSPGGTASTRGRTSTSCTGRSASPSRTFLQTTRSLSSPGWVRSAPWLRWFAPGSRSYS
jgi:hypothetical protein